MARDLGREIDTLYQLPLDEFTSARNALAKTAGTDGASVKGLQKPPIAAWAVNQLYWNRRDVYDTLIEAAETLRASHTAVLAGKSADLRAAGKDHEAALEAALKASIGLLQESGHPKWQNIDLNDLPPGWNVSECVNAGLEPSYDLSCQGEAPEAQPQPAGSAANSAYRERICAAIGC